MSGRATKREGRARSKKRETNPVHTAIEKSVGFYRLEPYHRSLLPRHKPMEGRAYDPLAGNLSAGDLALLGLALDSPADMAGGALSAISGRLGVLLVAVRSGKLSQPALYRELWAIKAHADAADAFAYRMLCEGARS